MNAGSKDGGLREFRSKDDLIRRRSSTVEHPICNRKVAGSTPIAGSRRRQTRQRIRSRWLRELGQLAEWLMAADCKSAALRATEVRILHCPPLITDVLHERGSNSGVESQPSKLLVAGSNPVSRSIERESGNGNRKSSRWCEDAMSEQNDSRFPVSDSRIGSAHVAQLAEHVLGKDEVTSSILVVGSMSGRG